MAEYVHQTLEEMIPELEEMNRLELFTTKETKVILKNRESLEYRLRQLTKTKASFLNYIQYEKKVLELLKIRRKKMSNDSKKREIEKSIADRIHQLYRLVTTRFKEDISLWIQHVDFSKALREKSYVSRLYDKALKIHGHQIDLWIQWSRWECSQDGNNDPQQAREILLKAHRVNPESQALLLEMFRMELTLAKNVLKRKSILGLARDPEEMTDDTNSDNEFLLASIIYRKGIELLPGDPEFHLKLLNVCSTCKEARDLQNTICEDLRRMYPGQAIVWDGLAWIHLSMFEKMDTDERAAAVHKFLQVYREAVKELPTEPMYSSCLNSHLSLSELKGVNPSLQQTVLESALSHFQEALRLQALSEDLFGQFLVLLTDMGLHDDAERVSELATKHHPSSSSLWLAWLTTVAQRGNPEELVSTLRSALAKIPGEDSWPLWHLALMTLAAACPSSSDSSSSGDESRSREEELLIALVEEACRFPGHRSVSRAAKEWALGWSLRHGGGAGGGVHALVRKLIPASQREHL